MSGCECKTGFFALRDCPEPVVGRCRHCRRAMCRRHGDPDSQLGECLDCGARRQSEPAQRGQAQSSRRAAITDSTDTRLDDSWVYAYRHRFYASGYLPIYAGTHHSSYYDRYDSRSFEHLAVENDDFGDDDGAGFGDS